MKRLRNALRTGIAVTSMLLFTGTSLTVSSLSAQPAGATKIVFITQEDTFEALMTLNIANADGTNVVPLVTGGYFFEPMLSPDGRHIVFEGEHSTSRGRNLFMIDTDGTNLHPLMQARSSLRPSGPIAWSPDSTQLIFGFLDYNRRPAGFYRMNTDGSDAERLEFDNLPVTSSISDFADTWVAWSPDGTRIAVKVRTLEDTGGNNGAFYTASPDGSGGALFTGLSAEGAASDRWVWSPDGAQILLYSLSTLFEEGVYLANADGSALQPLMGTASFPSSFAWCSDNSQIVFVANEAGVETMPGGDVWAINPDGSGLRSLNIDENVRGVGISCGVLPADVILPATPVSFPDAAG